MTIFMIFFFLKITCKYFDYLGNKYFIIQDVTKENIDDGWLDLNNFLQVPYCTDSNSGQYLGYQMFTTPFHWKKLYTIPLSKKLYFYFEYQISGNWDDDEIEIFVNELKVFSSILRLNDIERSCEQKFLFDSYGYFVINHAEDKIVLEIKTTASNAGFYLKNLMIVAFYQRGRDENLEQQKYTQQCPFQSNAIQNQYYDICGAEPEDQVELCDGWCPQYHLYNTFDNQCYYKAHCSYCSGSNSKLKCDDGYFTINEDDVSISECIEKCPFTHFLDDDGKTCTDYVEYYIQKENGKYPVNHYYLYKNLPDFLHYFRLNDMIITLTSIPQKQSFRNIFYKDEKFVLGTDDFFQSQNILIVQQIQTSQYRLNFQAKLHFIDFYPTKFEFYINDLQQKGFYIIPDEQNILQQDLADYVLYLNFWWYRTEKYPEIQNIFLFIVEQEMLNNEYKGQFYIEDLSIFSFECETDCMDCFNYQKCSPCVHPENKNPIDCSCLEGFIGVRRKCIYCPNYCASCILDNECVECLPESLRSNPPLCDTCPLYHFIDLETQFCKPCIEGCKICENGKTCDACLKGYFKNMDKLCVQTCPDGFFNDDTNLKDPLCTQCNKNCFKCENEATQCTECTGISTLYNNYCYTCVEGQYIQGIDCFPCITNCQSCLSIQCKLCEEFYFYKEITNECAQECDEGYYADSDTRRCEKCATYCKTCSSGTEQDCLTCVPGRVINLLTIYSGECLTTCQAGFYRVGDYCFQCWKGCQSCIDQTKYCLVCAENYYRLKSDNSCNLNCPDGYYNNKIGNLCSPCNLSCKTCKSFSQNSCLSCNPPLGYFQNQCLTECYEGYENLNNICVQCTQGCASCFGTMPNECLFCKKGYYFFNNQCYTKCPNHYIGIKPQYVCKCIYEDCVICDSGQFFLKNLCYSICPSTYFGYNGLCISCQYTCNTCFGESDDQCLSCNSGLILFQNLCIPECLGNTYHDIITNECKYCDESCLACIGPSNSECTACSGDALLTKHGECSDQCPENQYPIIGENRCNNCHPKCLTCFGKSSQNCLTCKHYFYLYECVDSCPDGFIVSTNGFSCEPNFKIVVNQCSYQCEKCELTKRFCKKCSANRISNPPICGCESGYFDDGASSECFKCDNKCLTCTQVASNCLSCKGDRLLPHCNCPSFSYDDGESVNCIKCQDNCLTCDFLGCTKCLGDRINLPECKCLDGYYEAFMYNCQECQKQCLTCQDTSMLCVKCAGIRQNPPICQCPDGYFENTDLDCQQCDLTCEDCNQYGCLSCIGNRIGPIDGECLCDLFGISRYDIGSIYCTDCSLGVPYFGLNEDFTGFFFDFGGQTFASSTIVGDLCQAFFSKVTLDKLGENAICDSDFNVYFGLNPNIQVGDIIQMNPVFYLSGCEHNYVQILKMPLQISPQINKETHKPKIIFNNLSQVDICLGVEIYFQKSYYDGGQKMKIISWQQDVPSTTKPEIEEILQNVIQNNSNNLFFPSKVLDLGQKYRFQVTIESFAKLQNTFFMQFQTIQRSNISFYPTNLTNQFYRFENISIPTKISYSNCYETELQEQKLLFEIVLKNQNKILKNGSITENLVNGFSYEFNLEFNQYYFNYDNPYQLLFVTSLERKDYQINFQQIFNIYIMHSIPLVTIQQGNKMVGYEEGFSLNSTIIDKDFTLLEIASVKYQCSWRCIDLINGKNCSNKQQQFFIFDNNCNQYIPAKSFDPYSVLIFQLTIVKEYVEYSTNVSIQIVEMSLPKLNITGHNQNKLYNYYDEFILHLHYPGVNPDLLQYAGAVIYNNEVQSTFQFYFLELKFKLQNHFTQLNQFIGNQILLRFSIYDPRFVLPSLNTLIVTMNIPPQSCTLIISNNSPLIEYLDKLQVSIQGCEDSNSPLHYNALLFSNQSIYQSDLLSANFYHYLLLQPFSTQKVFNLTFPYFSQEEQLLVFNIQDSLGGISNITQLIKIKKYLNLNETTFYEFESQFRDLDQTLIGYNIITQRLKGINSYIEYKQKLFENLLNISEQQLLKNNQTEILYRSILDLLEFNHTLIGLAEDKLNNLLMSNIEIAINQLQSIFQMQKQELISSYENNEKLIYLKQCLTYLNILSYGMSYKIKKNQSPSFYIEQVKIISDSIHNISVVNEPLFSSLSYSINMNLGYLTSKMAKQLISSDSQKEVIDSSHIHTNTSYHKYSMTRYIDNPYYLEDKFPKNSSGYQAINPLMNQGNSTENEMLTQKVFFKFPSIKQLANNTSIKCISRISTGEWNTDICSTKHINNETICECQSLNPTSIMESLKFIEDRTSKVFSSETLLAFGSFPFYKNYVFYFYLSITGIYLYMVYWGTKVDKKMFAQVSIEKVNDQIKQNVQAENKEMKLEILNSSDQITSQKTIIDQQKISSCQLIKQEGNGKQIVIQFQPDVPKFTLNSNAQENQSFIQLQGKLSGTKEQFVSVEDKGDKTPEKNEQFSKPQSKFSKLQVIKEQESPQNPSIQKKFSIESNQIIESNQAGLKNMILKKSISYLKAYFEYLKFFHQILSIIYKSDEKKPRSLRATIVYTGILGSLCILFLFNQPNNISFTFTLALFTFPLNKIYQLILEKLLITKKKSIRIFGAIFMLSSCGLISYVMLAGLVMLDSVDSANTQTQIFLGTVITDNIIYSPIQLFFQYIILLDFVKLPFIKMIFEKLLDEQAKEFLFGLIDYIQEL